MKKLNKVMVLWFLLLVVFEVLLGKLIIDWHSYKFFLLSIISIFWASLYFTNVARLKPILIKECKECGFLVPLKTNNTIELHCCPKNINMDTNKWPK